MAALNLLRHLAWRHAGLLAVCSFLLAALQFLICAAVSSANVGGALETLMRSLPPMAQAFVSMQLLGGFTARGLLAFGWNHPVAHAVGGAVAIVIAARAIAGEAETGTIELLLGQPISRSGYFLVHLGFGLAALAVTTAAGVAGTLLGQAAFHMAPFGAASLLRLAIVYAMLQAAWFAITLLLSAQGREGGRVATGGFLLLVLSYFAQAIGRLWDRAAFILPWTLHDYYSPQKILIDGAPIGRALTVLGAVAAAALGLAWARFRTRDLP